MNLAQGLDLLKIFLGNRGKARTIDEHAGQIRIFTVYAHMEIVVVLIVVKFGLFLVITRDHGSFGGAPPGGNSSHRPPGAF